MNKGICRKKYEHTKILITGVGHEISTTFKYQFKGQMIYLCLSTY